MAHADSGKKAHILVGQRAVVEPEMIQALYRASLPEVKVEEFRLSVQSVPWNPAFEGMIRKYQGTRQLLAVFWTIPGCFNSFEMPGTLNVGR